MKYLQPDPFLLFLAFFAVTTVMAQESFNYTTGRNFITYRVPSDLIGPPILTHRNERLAGDDSRIFVTGYLTSSFFKEISLGDLSISMIKWPESCPNWSDVEKLLHEHLSRPGTKVTLTDQSFQRVPWKIFEQRSEKNDALIGVSCYAPLSDGEIVYVGLVINETTKVSIARRQSYKAAVYELLTSITVRPIK